MSIKKLIARIFFGAEFLVWLFLYQYGQQGMHTLYFVRCSNKELEQKVAQETSTLAALEKERVAWQTNTFYKEKAAREQLQMARQGELVFYVT